MIGNKCGKLWREGPADPVMVTFPPIELHHWRGNERHGLNNQYLYLNTSSKIKKIILAGANSVLLQIYIPHLFHMAAVDNTQ